jgi:hypothetical protein
LKSPKLSCAAIGLLGAKLDGLSDITKMLVCQACYKDKYSNDMSVFEKYADWKAINAVCGESAQKEICKTGYRKKIEDGKFKDNLIAACTSWGK